MTEPKTIPTTAEAAKPSQWRLWLVGALALAALILLFIYAERQLRDVSAVVDTKPESVAESALLSVTDQSAGMRVLVEMIDVAPPGVWAVVHERREGELGNALGATRVRGPATEVAIELLRGTEAGQDYAVVLYRNEEQQSFALPGASVYVDFDSGERVEARFTAL